MTKETTLHQWEDIYICIKPKKVQSKWKQQQTTSTVIQQGNIGKQGPN